MINAYWTSYYKNLAEEPYKSLQEVHDRILEEYDRQRLEDELVERVLNRIMIMIDTGEAVGKIKELDNLIKNLGK